MSYNTKQNRGAGSPEKMPIAEVSRRVFLREILLTAAVVAGATQGAGASPPKMSAKAPPAPKLKTTEFPDGTGTIGLPIGWSIDGSYRGTCGCKGPGNSSVIMGFPWVIGRPDHPANNIDGVPPTSPLAPIGDLTGALRAVLAKSGLTLTSVRSRPAPPPSPGIPTAYLLYTYERNGKTLAGLGYFSTLQYPDSSPYWELFSSAVVAPKEQFMRELPTLMAIYNSWRPNGKKPREGSAGAMMDDVKEANRKLYDETMKSQRDSFDRMQARYKEEVLMAP